MTEESKPQFVIKRTKNGQFYFNLNKANGQTIVSSEIYTTKAGCLNGIESVMKNAVIAHTEDLTDD